MASSDSERILTFDAELRDRIAANIAAHDRAEVTLAGRRHAAVAIVVVGSDVGEDHTDAHAADVADMADIPGFDASMVASDGLDGRMVDVAGGAAFVLCRRSNRLNSHARQWALPGGRIDAGETAVDAALRETVEEVGLDLDESAVLGLLDDYETRSGYVMTPVVVWGGDDAVLRPNPAEVAAAYRIGVHHLRRSDSPRFVSIPESDRPVVQVPIGGDLIHAPTGAVLVQFRWVCLDGRHNARVGHFEQPVFAWK